MRKLALALFAIALFLISHSSPCAVEEFTPADFVDPWIGSRGNGNVFIGPSLPFGMIKPGPDVGDNASNSGWRPEGNINGFSQTHVSGTGGGSKYGNILVMPACGKLELSDISSPREGEVAKLGYYSVKLSRYNIKAEITASDRAAAYRFTYPDCETPRIIFDAGHILYNNIAGEGQILTSSEVQVLSEREVCGSASVKGGWNKQPIPYTVYFYALCDSPAQDFGVFEDSTPKPREKKALSSDGKKTGAWLEFKPQGARAVNMKIGISFVSVKKAKEYAARLASFEETLKKARQIWNRALSPIRVESSKPEYLRLFYTCLYHAMLMPVDRSGENPLWTSKEPYYDDFYAIWDTFRTSGPLLNILAPKRQSEIVRALVDIHKNEGFLPDGRSGNYNGRTQGGSNADVYIADAFLKGIRGVNWKAAYLALKTDAEVEPEDQFKEGRGGLKDWIELGYLAKESVDRSPGKHLEYAYNDFCIAQMAEALGYKDEAKTYYKRSAQWSKLWDADLEHDGFKGFIRTRHRDGSWLKDFSPMQGCSWHGDTFYEGNSWTYSFFAPHDVEGLIRLCGGSEAFAKRLDEFFEGPGKCDISNEPFFLTPYLYICAGRCDKAAERVRKVMSHFKAAPDGLPGNDDSGALGAWWALSAMSIFPNAGQDYYFIGSPLFDKTTINLPENKTFEIIAKNNSEKNIYVKSATLNSRPLDRAWLRHSEIAAGGELILEMSDTPSAWGSKNPPPSPLARKR